MVGISYQVSTQYRSAPTLACTILISIHQYDAGRLGSTIVNLSVPGEFSIVRRFVSGPSFTLTPY